MGRTVQTVQDFTTGAVTAETNKTTAYTYNSAGQTALTVWLTSGVETTAYIYGVTTASGSGINSNDIVGITESPNPTTGAPSTSYETTVTVDAFGDTLTSTDPNGTEHTYTYDVLGRQTVDTATTLGSNIDGAVRRITMAYDSQGNAYLVTSYSATTGGTVVNQVEDVYNGLGQLVGEYQAVSGSVNTSTTPEVQYTYTEMASGMNNSRLTTMIYPDGYTITYNYASGIDSTISRLTSLSDFTGTLESYKYLGLGTVVERDHPESGVNLTYISQSGGTGDAGDQYVGLDRFGRVVDQNWYDPSTSTSVDEIQYGYDADGNVLWQNDTINSSFSAVYTYDALNQLASFARGTLNSGKTGISGTASVSETWTYDAAGNRTADSTTTSSGTTNVTEGSNAQNEITSLSSGFVPAYDADGETTSDENALIYVYDAWGREVTVKSYPGTTLETESYDGLNNRVTDTVGGTTTNRYYSTSGQVLEEQVGTKYTQRYVWSPVYVNAMIDRDADTSGSGLTATGTSYTRLWPATDANFDVVTLINNSGAAVNCILPTGKIVCMNKETYYILASDSDLKCYKIDVKQKAESRIVELPRATLKKFTNQWYNLFALNDVYWCYYLIKHSVSFGLRSTFQIDLPRMADTEKLFEYRSKILADN